MPSKGNPDSHASTGLSLFINRLPKPIFFGLAGILGCLIGWLLGEPVLLLLKEDKTAQGSSGGQAPVLVFSPEIQKLLDNAGAEKGAIEIALHWKTTDDLDLHCVDPAGNRIYWRPERKRSPSGGWLDVDMNAEPPFQNNPVEHIRWKEGEYPKGEYRVFVHYFKNRGNPSPVPFTVAFKANGRVQEFKGKAIYKNWEDRAQGSQPDSLKDFERIFFSAIEPVEITTFDPDDAPTKKYTPTQPSLKAALIMGLWTALLAVFTSLLLVMAQNHLSRRPLMTGQNAGVIVLGGVLAGLLSGIISQYLFSVATISIVAKYPNVDWLLRAGVVVGWMLLGGLMGAAMGWFIPNLPKVRASVAGIMGGFIGAVAFLLALKFAGETAGRMIGTAILGFSIGLMVAIVEMLFREASLEVLWAPMESTHHSLGTRPVTVGGGDDHVVIRGLPQNAIKIIMDQGRIICTQADGKESQLKDGSRIDVGKVKLMIHASN